MVLASLTFYELVEFYTIDGERPRAISNFEARGS